ncbi:hypothetical protein Ancab_036185 [Ancistrocladus abbreviatus]
MRSRSSLQGQQRVPTPKGTARSRGRSTHLHLQLGWCLPFLNSNYGEWRKFVVQKIQIPDESTKPLMKN